MEFIVSKSLQIEHDELHEELSKIAKERGKIGDAAKAVAEVLQPHFEKEEEFALPPLGLLSSIAKGKIESEMGKILKQTVKLKADLPKMLEEHIAIVVQLKILKDLAKKEGKLEYIRFAEKLTLHAQNEEEVLYPASILVGEYLKLVLKKR